MSRELRPDVVAHIMCVRGEHQTQRALRQPMPTCPPFSLYAPCTQTPTSVLFVHPWQVIFCTTHSTIVSLSPSLPCSCYDYLTDNSPCDDEGGHRELEWGKVRRRVTLCVLCFERATSSQPCAPWRLLCPTAHRLVPNPLPISCT